ncbi:MAG TPA: hypothetical protein VL547_20815 [Dinghuibacter sp.]|uniref:hypothetical protein n=1 Tax=Dinghuibacter sp. TaxID=2024697 RepID=UPI002CB2F9D8|nr:hypothetical protein [Dinghuibacter sp.]HTJ14499.1 hypothetical protein [Dinghuibacter sp.]
MYDTLKAHFGQADAEAIVDGIEEIVDTRNEVLRNELASKRELYGVRDELKSEIADLRLDMTREFATVRGEIATIKVGLTKTIWITSLVQFLAVVGALLAIIQSLKK